MSSRNRSAAPSIFSRRPSGRIQSQRDVGGRFPSPGQGRSVAEFSWKVVSLSLEARLRGNTCSPWSQADVPEIVERLGDRVPIAPNSRRIASDSSNSARRRSREPAPYKENLCCCVTRSTKSRCSRRSSEPRRPYARCCRTSPGSLPTDSTVLITGETGTGKELDRSGDPSSVQRCPRILVSVNCAVVPGALVASELFGHEKGAFTGARPAAGSAASSSAEGGTIFLDEIGELPPGDAGRPVARPSGARVRARLRGPADPHRCPRDRIDPNRKPGRSRGGGAKTA